MDGSGLATAAYWATRLETIADIAFLVVIVALAVELVAGRVAKRFEREIDAARETAIAQANARAAEAQLALEQFKAPRLMTAELVKRLTDDVLPLIPKDRPPSIGALPATVYNLQFASQLASVLGLNVNQGAAEVQVGPARGVVAAYVTLNERGKKIAEAFAKALNDSGIQATAAPGLMERLFHIPGSNLDPTDPGSSWVVIVVGDKP
jgi:hypothetical protein